ncbi:MAG: hypothetical protein O2923_12185 [Verrucomicrobia bacterium]|nr:hypothetical protein [Verrucomicrobiota bacterium]MDA1087274.1 hypothetical protein [Verrucomicrobiota bacterium]
MSSRPWDVPMFLDAAWRVFCGQRPHNDFYSHLGALPFYVHAAGFRLCGPSVAAIPCGNVLLMGLLAPFAVWILVRRFQGFLAAVAICFVGMLMLAPRPLGDPYFFNDYAMLYNRFGEGILFLFVISLFVPTAGTGTARRRDHLDPVVGGVLLSLLLFVKLNYFVVGCLAFAFAGGLRFVSHRGVLILLLSFFTVSVAIYAATGISVSQMFNDMAIMAAAQDYQRKLASICIQGAKHSLILLPIAAISVLVLRSCLRKRDRGFGWAFFCVNLMLAGSSLMLLASNTQRNEMPLLAAAALICIHVLWRRSRMIEPGGFGVGCYDLSVCLLLSLYFVPTMGSDFAAFRNSYSNAIRADRPNPAFRATNLRDFVFESNGPLGSEMLRYQERVADGIALVSSQLDANDSLCVVTFTNPYVMALGMRPQDGGAICYYYGITMARKGHPPWRRIIGDAKYLLCGEGGLDQFREIFSSQEIDVAFVLVEASVHHELYALERSGASVTAE